MNIGILTLELASNYGGILQAYALQTVLERMGHDACLIQKRRFPLRLPLWKMPFSYGKRILKNVMGHPCPVFYEHYENKRLPIIRQHTDRFINEYIKRRVVKNFSEIKENDFDAIVVGSDQVWRPKYFYDAHDAIERAYLDFTQGWNIRRIAYAASFGTDEWEYTTLQTDNCSRLVRNFDAVSVREKSAIAQCRDYLGVQATHVPDPTMLLDAEDYTRLFKDAGTPESKGTLLCYVLDETPEKSVLISRIAEEKGLIPFRVNSKVENPDAPLSERVQPPVEQWLRGFYDAEYVVTDSFHACVFSILFNKPFTVVGNIGRGLSRFDSLLDMFDLKDRMIMNVSEYKGHAEINWEHVTSILNNARKTAKDFLYNILA